MNRIFSLLFAVLLIFGVVAGISLASPTLQEFDNEQFMPLILNWGNSGQPGDGGIPGGPYTAGENVTLKRWGTEHRAAVPDQLLISGEPEQLDILESFLFTARALSASELALYSIDLGEDDLGKKMELRSYHTSKSIEEVRELIDVHHLGLIVSPNYLVGSPWIIGGEPWGPGGAPWIIGGEPWIIGGEPWKILPDPAHGDVIHDLPWQQWAFLPEHGINLYDSEGFRKVSWSGSGVKIIVLDTSPYEGASISEEPFPVPMRILYPALDFPVVEEGIEVHPLLKEHGLFVAGLAHIVAPEAQIELRRVLNEEATGTVGALIAVLNDIKGSEDLGRLVINLSMGYLPENLPEDSLDEDADAEARALKFVLGELRDGGAIIVAASGNKAGWSADGPLLPGVGYEGIKARYASILPARWPETIGVGGHGISSSGETVTSCFANGTGDFNNYTPETGFIHFFNDPTIQAPAGNGFDEPAGVSPTDVIACQHPFTISDREEVCGEGASAYDCHVALLSTTSTGYQYWMGTSFATPIVSGMAALLRQACPASTSSAEAIRRHLIDNFDPEARYDLSTLIPATEAGCP